MKTVVLAVLIFCCTLTGTAQPGDYNGPAKITVKAFWDGAAKLEKSVANGGSALDGDNLVGLFRKIGDTKQKDPSYDVSAMEAKAKELSAGMGRIKKNNEAAVQNNQDKRMIYNKVSELLRSLFEVSVDVSTHDLPKVTATINAYKQRTEELLKLDMSQNKKDLERELRYINASAKHAEKDLAELETHCRGAINADYALAEYYELQFHQARWDAAQRVYPAEESFKTAYQLATKLLKGLGSPDDIKAMASKSKEQKIKDTRVPAGLVSDAALEKIFVETFNKYHSEEFKGTAFKAVILSSEWSVERHEVTGIVTGRIRKGAVVYKGKDGKCYLVASFFIRQEYVGNSFLANTISAYPVMGSYEMLCANVK
ncbi:MAG: hypothetical protein NTW29_22855 [Bacteroidetes bacterium]|nr:hypothetical protein [Bacteroidota bacterium]